MAEVHFGKKQSAGVRFEEARGPDGTRIYAIGDIHGRLDLLKALHETIDAEVKSDRVDDWRIIHLGDYVDRGPDSRGVLEFLIDAQTRDARNITIAGNHDLALLEFLADPDPDSLFIQYGGIQTARSYGAEIDFNRGNWLETVHAAFAAALPKRHADFIRDCRLSTDLGNFFFCHAGVRPGVALDRQDPHDLIWIREPFLSHSGLHPKVIVHGHTITPDPDVRANRVNVDTGAWRSGVLTALVVEGDRKRLIRTAGETAEALPQL